MARDKRAGAAVVTRREFFGLAAAALVIVPDALRAQQARRVKRIGWLCNFAITPAEFQERVARFKLPALGWIEGQNLIVEGRSTGGDTNLLFALADELVRLKVDLIVAEGTIVALAVKKSTTTIPIIVIRSADPVLSGLVASLAKPGGNVTGTTTNTPDLDLKRLQILHELLPAAKRVGKFVDPEHPVDRLTRNQYERTLASLGLQPVFIDNPPVSELESAVAEAARRGAQVLHVPPEPSWGDEYVRIYQAAQKRSLPVMAENSFFLAAGALVSYGPDDEELDRLLAVLIDKVLRGAKPADVPIQQPLKLDLGINLKVAKELGIKVPPSLLLRADKVIQ